MSIESGGFFTASEEVDGVATLSTLLAGSAAERRVLARQAMPVAHLHELLGVRELGLSGLLSQYLLPDLARMAPTQQAALHACLVERWDSLRSDRELVETLQKTPLLRDARTGALRCASYFLDPEVPALALAFDDYPGRFPAPEVSRSPQWLTLLREIGLRSEVDAELFLECVHHVEAAWRNGASGGGAGAAAIAATAKAEKLLKFLWQNFAQISQGSPAFWSRLAKVAIVPVAPVVPSAVASEAHSGAEPTKLSGGGAPPRVLVPYSACATPKDAALSWTILPIVPADLLPPESWHGRLRMQSPPARSVVLTHLTTICSASAADNASTAASATTLQRWMYTRDPVTVFRAIFDYLTPEWQSLSSAERSAVKALACVPIGNLLVRPAGRLFFRLVEPLAPLMFEVPRAFGANDVLLKALGTKAAPTVHDFASLLEDLRRVSGDAPLNPNELEAVLRVVALMSRIGASDGVAFAPGDASAEGAARARGGLAGGAEQLVALLRRAAGRDVVVLVPDERGVLSDATACVFNDNPGLAERMDVDRIRFVNARVTLPCCRRLNIRRLSEVVEEALPRRFSPAALRMDAPAEAAHAERLSATLASREFAYGVAQIVMHQTPHVEGGGGAAAGGGRTEFAAVERAVGEALESTTVAFVRELRTRFLVNGADVTHVGAARGDGVASLSFIDRAAHVIYIAAGALPGSVSVEQVRVDFIYRYTLCESC